jgi:hypothetical protein
MKRIINYVKLLSVLILISACSTELDNYPEPDATLQGSIINSNTGEPLQTEIGDRGTRIKLLELSWNDNPTPQYLYSMQEGTYNNNKIFGGTYNIIPEGAFVPLIQVSSEGDTIVDQSKIMEVPSNEITTVDFEVEPFLEVDWVGEPVINEDGTITVQVRVTRGTDNPNFQPNMNAVFLFVNNTKYLGDNNWDNRYSNAVVYGGTSGNDLFGEVISLTTRGGALPKGRDFYFRVGARTDYGLQRYNYNEPFVVSIPGNE